MSEVYAPVPPPLTAVISPSLMEICSLLLLVSLFSIVDDMVVKKIYLVFGFLLADVSYVVILFNL